LFIVVQLILVSVGFINYQLGYLTINLTAILAYFYYLSL